MPTSNLPQFNQINIATIVAEVKTILDKNREDLFCFLSNQKDIDWSLMEKLADLNDRLQRFWSPINHLHAVKQTPALREAYNQCLPLLSTYSSEISQNRALYKAMKTLVSSNHAFDYAQKKCIHHELRDFHLGGIDLVKEKQKRYCDIQAQLSQMSSKFEENLLDATASWYKHITDKSTLQGLPDYVVANAEKAAKEKNLQGYLLTIDNTAYFPVLMYADHRVLREELYKAYITRASELGDSRYDNSPILLEVLYLRHELSQLLGFTNYAQMSLASNKMAASIEEVRDFLEKLVLATRTKAQVEWKILCEFAYARDKIKKLEPWDNLYYREKLIEKNFGISEDILRCYFPVEKVLSGLFLLIQHLFGMQVNEIKHVDVWDSSVRFFTITDSQQQVRGQFYLDMYARPEKREGAWMDEYRSRRRLNNGTIQLPIAFLTCNFAPPIDSSRTALLTHEDVITLFHEFGHGLQHMLTQIDYEGVSGINGVAWDAIELPSQFLEYFAWEKPVLDLISSHYETGQSLPDNFIQPLRTARNFQAGLQLLRQLELALFDFRLHAEFDPEKGYAQIQLLLNEVREKTQIVPVSACNRFQHGFSHIFAGGYAAGYYSYLWAQVLSCDAFYKFLEEGLLNSATGQAFLETILEQGGAVDAMELFKKFRGRAPTIQPFMQSLDIR